MKILAHFTDFNHRPERKKLNTFGALGYYRMFKPSQCLTNHKVDLRGTDIISYGDTFESNWENIFKKYDVFWAVHFLQEQSQAAQAYCAEKYGKLLIYDLDDNYLDIPDTNPVAEKFKATKRSRAILSASFSFADAITVSTEPLKERLAAHLKKVFGMTKPIYVIPNMNDINDWNFPIAPKNKDKIVVAYTGSNSHQDDLQIVMPVMLKLMKKYPKLHFEILGAIDKSKLDNYFKGWDMEILERVAMLPATATFWEYPEWMSKQSWDIGLAPLVDSAFTRCKSHIKWMEYAMFKIPCVASRVYPYSTELAGRPVIEDGKTGFLCRNSEWETTLERLILDKDLREEIGENAYEAVKKNWQYKDSEIQETFEKMIKDLKGKKPLQNKDILKSSVPKRSRK